MDEFNICPHCQKPGIFVSTRRYYSRGWPEVCRECGGLSYDRPHGMGCLFQLLIEISAPPFLLCILIASWWLKGVIAAAAIAVAILMRRKQARRKSALRFRPITQEKSRMSRRVQLSMALAAFVFAILLAWFMASRPARPSAPLKMNWKWPVRSARAFPCLIPVGTSLVPAVVL